jgi:hypothetical protein
LRRIKAPSANGGHASTAGRDARSFAGALAVLLCLLVFAPAAKAAVTHPFVSSFGPDGTSGTTFSDPRSIAVDQGSGDLYVFDFGAGNIQRFDSSGSPLAFSALGSPAGSSNVINGSGDGISDADATPQNFFSASFASQVAVDSSGTATDGNIYFTDTSNQVVDVFAASGAYLGQLDGSTTPQGTWADSFASPCGVATDPSGNLYVATISGTIDRYAPSGSPVTDPDYDAQIDGLGFGTCPLAADSTGAVYNVATNFGTAPLTKYAASDFGTTAPPGTAIDPNSTTVALDPVSEDVYADQGGRVVQYDSSGTQVGGFGGAQLSDSHGVAVRGSTDFAYASDSTSQQVSIYGAAVPTTAPTVAIDPPSSVTATTAHLSGTVNPQGTATSWHFEYSTDHANWTPVGSDQDAGSGSADVPVSADPSGLLPNTTYFVRLVASNEIDPPAISAEETFTTQDTTPPTVSIDPPSSVTATTAHLSGTVNPQGTATSWHFEYSTDHANWTPVGSDQDAGSGSADVPVSADPSGLLPNTTYFVRLVASNPFDPPTISSEESFATLAAAPVVGPVEFSEIAPTSVRLTGQIDAENSPTTYRFEYGTDTSYGSAIPVPDGNAGSNSEPVSVSKKLTGLQPDTTYHARLVATNAAGTVEGPDAEFTTPSGVIPPLGERGYELVSPAGGGTYEVKHAWGIGQGGPEALSAQASTPDGKHVTFTLTAGGTLPGMVSDGEVPDYFIATRGTDGWDSASPLSDRSGPGCNAFSPTSKFVTISDDASRELLTIFCSLDKRRFSGTDGSGAPLDQDSDPNGTGGGAGTLYGVDVASDTTEFLGTAYGAGGPVPRDSSFPDNGDRFLGGTPDLSVVYLASKAPLTPDAASGSGVFVFRRQAGTTTLVTKLANGQGFGLHGFCVIPFSCSFPDPLGKPGTVSVDGAAFTTSVQGAVSGVVPGDTDEVTDVFQWRGDDVTWVSQSERTPADTPANREFEGASDDGRQVFFSTAEQMVGDGVTQGDLDTVSDVYEYDFDEPAGSRLSRISVRDAGCAPPVCDDNASDTTPATHSQAKFVTVSPDGQRVFFISGDRLSADDTDSQQSLYVRDLENGATLYVAPVGAGVSDATNGDDAGPFIEGSLTTALQLSTSPNASNFANRPIQVSQDGRTAAVELVTDVPLPAGRGGPDADGTRDLYVWHQGDGLRRVRQGLGADDSTITVPSLGCKARTFGGGRAICRAVSQDGARVFFETTDALVPEDADSGQTDVYEYHPSDGGVTLVSPPGDAPFPSLYVDSSVSGDDVFFLTAETVDPSRDTDGARIDLYDARTGEVFPAAAPPPPPCEGDACQPPPTASPEADRPASAILSNPGNRREVRDCRAIARRAERVGKLAKRARNAARHASGPGARALRRRAARLTKRARALSKQAKSCKRANRRTVR